MHITSPLDRTSALQARLVAFARRFVGDHGEAEDVAQEAMLRAAKGWGRLRSAERAEAWVFRICRHAAIDHVRARRVRQAVWGSLPTEVGEWAAAPAPSDDGPVLCQASREALERALRPGVRGGRLPAHHRLLLALHYERGLSQATICRMTGLSPSALRVRLFRARGWLALQAGQRERARAGATAAVHEGPGGPRHQGQGGPGPIADLWNPLPNCRPRPGRGAPSAAWT